MRIITVIASLLLVPMIMSSNVAHADDARSSVPWERSCRAYSSSRHFVSESTLYCLRQQDQKACREEAHKYFDRCKYSGDFQKIAARINARMLLVLALSSVRSVHHIDL
jgi:hypothetical protein